MAGNCWEFLEMAGKAGNEWKSWKLLEIAEHGQKWLDITRDDCKRLKMARNGWNGWIWLEMV